MQRPWRQAVPALLGFAVAIVAGGCSADAIVSPGVTTTFAVGTGLHSISVGSLTREYVLHTPTRRPTNSSGMLLGYPLIIVLHGTNGSGDDMRAMTNMDSVSEANRTIVAYPNGIGGGGGLYPTDWNAGSCCGAAGREGIDDVAFIKAMIAKVSTEMPVDPKRIYIAGFSDGGRMAYRLACELSAQIAAIAVVSGSLRVEDCVPDKPVALIAIHGTDDDIVPWDEDPDTQPPESMSGVATTLPPSVQFWISENGCDAGATAAYNDRVSLITFSACTADVAFYAVDGGVHSWPQLTDASSADPDATFSATAAIADFFKHRRLK